MMAGERFCSRLADAESLAGQDRPVVTRVDGNVKTIGSEKVSSKRRLASPSCDALHHQDHGCAKDAAFEESQFETNELGAEYKDQAESTTCK